MNKFNKGKLLGVVAASLSAVSLMGVGFATWIIGTQNKVSDGSIAIEADDVKIEFCDELLSSSLVIFKTMFLTFASKPFCFVYK